MLRRAPKYNAVRVVKNFQFNRQAARRLLQAAALQLPVQTDIVYISTAE
jgi:hypothetical protein